MIERNEISGMTFEEEVINIIYDLLVQNPIKGCYQLQIEDLTEIIDCVNNSDKSITLRNNDVEYKISIQKTFVART